jgi:RNA polymerase sigma-70 factor, ECF subfamily
MSWSPSFGGLSPSCKETRLSATNKEMTGDTCCDAKQFRQNQKPPVIESRAACHRANSSGEADRKRALEQLVDLNYRPVYRYALALCRNEADAADLTQQSFLLLSRHFDQIREPSQIRFWLTTTLRREFFRTIHRTRYHHVPFDPDRHDEPAGDTTALQPSDAAIVLKMLASVSETYRPVIELFYLGQLSYKEIAKALNIPIGTVMSRLSRGKKELRFLLDSVDAELL